MNRTGWVGLGALALLCSFGLTGGCGEDADIVANQVSDFIQTVGTPDGFATGALVQGEQPEPTGGPEADVDIGTATVLTGGGLTADVSSDVPFAHVLVYIEGVDDYFRVTLPDETSSAAVAIGLTADVPEASFSLRVGCVSADGAVGDYVPTTITVESSEAGDTP